MLRYILSAIITMNLLFISGISLGTIFDQENEESSSESKPILMQNGQVPQKPTAGAKAASSAKEAKQATEEKTSDQGEIQGNPKAEDRPQRKEYQYDLPMNFHDPNDKPRKWAYEYEIDFKTYTSYPSKEKEKAESEVYGNVSTKKYHRATCRYAKGDKIKRFESEEAAKKRGYIPCSRCIKKKKKGKGN